MKSHNSPILSSPSAQCVVSCVLSPKSLYHSFKTSWGMQALQGSTVRELQESTQSTRKQVWVFLSCPQLINNKAQGIPSNVRQSDLHFQHGHHWMVKLYYDNINLFPVITLIQFRNMFITEKSFNSVTEMLGGK